MADLMLVFLFPSTNYSNAKQKVMCHKRGTEKCSEFREWRYNYLELGWHRKEFMKEVAFERGFEDGQI